MLKRIFACITFLGMLLSLNSGVSAFGNCSLSNEMIASCESTVLTQTEYEEKLNNPSNDVESVRTVIETYIAISHASIVKSDSYDLSRW